MIRRTRWRSSAERLAEASWPKADPIGQQVSVDNGTTWATVVGVVGDVRQNNLSDAVTDEVYQPFATRPGSALRVLARTKGPMELFRRDIKGIVHELDNQQPVYAIQSLDDLRGTRLSEPRVTTTLMLLFAILALVITAGGLGGVIGFSVSQRISEIGIRMALGAKPAQVLGMVMRQGMSIVLVGLVVGLVRRGVWRAVDQRTVVRGGRDGRADVRWCGGAACRHRGDGVLYPGTAARWGWIRYKRCGRGDRR